MSEDTENLSEEPETEEMAESDDFSDGEECCKQLFRSDR